MRHLQEGSGGGRPVEEANTQEVILIKDGIKRRAAGGTPELQEAESHVIVHGYYSHK